MFRFNRLASSFRSLSSSALPSLRSISSSSIIRSSSVAPSFSTLFGLSAAASLMIGSYTYYSVAHAAVDDSAVSAEISKEQSLDAEEAAAGAEEGGENEFILPEKSERRYIHPNDRTVNYYSADSLLDALSSSSFSSPPILLFITEEGCSACARMKPVIKQLSESINAAGIDGKIIIGLMDGDRNFNKQLFTQEEAMAVPRIKLFFPADNKSINGNNNNNNNNNNNFRSIPYNGRYNSKAIVEWLQIQLGGSSLFPLDNLIKEINNRDIDTTRLIQEISRQTLEKDISGILYSKSPCGKETMNYITTLMSRSYASTSNELINDKIMDTLFEEKQSCLEKKENALIKYWEIIEETAKDNLEGLQERVKNKKNKQQQEKKN